MSHLTWAKEYASLGSQADGSSEDSCEYLVEYDNSEHVFPDDENGVLS